MKLPKKLRFILLFILAILFNLVVFLPSNDLFIIVRGGSMEPTLKNNQVVLATKDTSKLFVGDIVVIQKNNELMIKRITAMQGAKYAENTSDEHSFVLIPEWFDFNNHIASGVKLILKEIPANYFFVEGDNPDKSIDSKNFGLVRRNEIIAKCLYN
jgi:signal peptidase I